jgi:hypothetical protein
MVHKYSNADDVTLLFSTRKAKSMIKIVNGKFCIALKQDKLMEIQRIAVHSHTANMWYHEWIILNVILPLTSPVNNDIADYCILLPKLQANGMPSKQQEHVYVAINLEWEDLQPNGTFALP